MGWLSVLHRKVGPLEDSESSVAPYPKVDVGSWKESISGVYIKIQQWRLLGSSIRFVCRGRLMLNKGGSFFFLVFLVSQMLIFLSVFGFFEIWKNTKSFGKMVFPLTFVLFGFYSIANIFNVVFTDPGILARGIYDPVKELLLLQHLKETYGIKKFSYAKMVPDVIEIDGEEAERFYCIDCRAYREFRTYHCPHCLVCIDRYDHHCLMLGKCIGRRNYGYFLKFIWSMAFSLLGMMIYSMTNFITYWIAEGFLAAASKSPTSFVFLASLIFPPCGAAYMFIIAYTHLCLVWTDTTLKERNDGIKGLAKPFKQHKNFCQAVFERIGHICAVLCIKPPPPNIYPHKYLHVRAIPSDQKARLYVNEHHNSLIPICRGKKKSRSKILHTYTVRKILGHPLIVRGHVSVKRLRGKHSWIIKPKRSVKNKYSKYI